jgi:hypothetical protein
VSNDAILTLPASNLAQNANLIINPPPPTTVALLSINGDDAQRSRLTKFDITLSGAMPLTSLGAISVTRVGNPYTVDTSNGPPGYCGGVRQSFRRKPLKRQGRRFSAPARSVFNYPTRIRT